MLTTCVSRRLSSCATSYQEKGVKVIACEPFAKDTEVQNIPNVSFEEVLKADYLVITLGHTLFKENKDKIAEKPYFDCVGMME